MDQSDIICLQNEKGATGSTQQITCPLWRVPLLVIGTFASQGYSLQMAATIDMFGAGPIEMNNRFYWNLQEAILVARWLCPFESVQAAGMNYLYKS